MTEKPKRRRRTKAEMERARRRREAGRARNLRTRHRMTPEQYDDILAHQGGVCYICQRARGATRALAVDHDHAVARERCSHDPDESCEDCWRGLLCSRCNDMLGHARDSREFFRRAMHYLRYPPAQIWFLGAEDFEPPEFRACR